MPCGIFTDDLRVQAMKEDLWKSSGKVAKGAMSTLSKTNIVPKKQAFLDRRKVIFHPPFRRYVNFREYEVARRLQDASTIRKSVVQAQELHKVESRIFGITEP